MIDITLPAFFTTFEVRLVLTLLFAFVVGLEREMHGKAAGVKTFVALCMSSFLLGHVSTLTEWDPMRLAVGVITGVGFLGAGALMKDSTSGTVEGLTTAAVIWAVAAISLTFGLGHVEAASIIACVIGIVTVFSRQIDSMIKLIVNKGR